MSGLSSAEIAGRFTEHFVASGHVRVPSASLIAPDPTLLLVNAGMVPFKPYLLGQEPAPYPRATSVQKCVRTPDIDEVGKTTRHGTFFQMAGNFSFGDYFKPEAIRLAWELITRPAADGGFGFDEALLWVTVFHDDDEAAEIWRSDIGVPPKRIVRRGLADNFWSMGVPGPCGPCSEIYLDRGPAYGPDGGPAVDEDRFLEFWNLVFMQFERGAGTGKDDFPIVGDLPAKNIDTGLGLERVALLQQGVDNLYEIDQVRPVLDRAADLAGRRYGADHDADVRLRVVADHVRTALMLIGDGITPTNEGRGYVLRRILRRAVRSMRLLGFGDPALPELLPIALDCMSATYPELVGDFGRISTYAYGEEKAFRTTLRAGTTIFDTAVRDTSAAGGRRLGAEAAFGLHDTHGFPIDLTIEMAAEQGLTVDEEGFRRLMAQQRLRAKDDSRAKKTGHVDLSAYRRLLDVAGPSRITVYDEVARQATVRGLLDPSGAALPAAGEGHEVDVVLDATPFYAESGGQVADTGRLVFDGGEAEVLDVQAPIPGLVVHRALVRRGELTLGADVFAAVDVERRRAVSRSHTATHLVHQAIRARLGAEASQAGSLNAPGRLRFDFHAPGAVPPSVLADAEAQVNGVLLDDLAVRAFVTSQDEARRLGAIAMFGEKYGDRVRVVEVGDYSRELCGGTHAARSGQLGMVKLLSESSIGAGIRRVEALVGLDAYAFLAREHVLVSQLAELLKVPAAELPERIGATVERLRQAERELERLRVAEVLAGAGAFAAGAKDVFGVALVAQSAPAGTGGDELRRLVLDVRGRLDPMRPAVVVLAAVADGRAQVVAATNETARARGVRAGEIIREIAPALGGGGGGKDDLAQGGGSRAGGVPEAIARAERFVGRRVTSDA